MNTKGTLKIIALLLAVAVGLLALGSGPDAEDVAQQEYCEMVALYRADHTTGWPDFHHTYDTECTDHANTKR